MKKLFISFSLICFLFLFVFPFKLQAAENAEIGVSPAYSDPKNPLTKAWFIYGLHPTEEKTDFVLIQNYTDKILEVKLYPVDATTTAQGDFTLELEQETRETVGAWVKLAAQTVTLKPYEKYKLKFTIHIPQDAPVGDHAGGIIVEPVVKQTITTQEGVNIQMVRRVGVRIYETVPGEKVFSLDITKIGKVISEDKLFYTILLTNDGNVILDPRVTLTISSLVGRRVINVDAGKIGMILPKKARLVEINTGKSPPFLDRHSLTVDAFYGDSKKTTTNSEFIFVHYVLPIVTLGIIASLIVLFLWMKKQRLKKNLPPMPISTGEPVLDDVTEVRLVARHIKAIGIGIILLVVGSVVVATIFVSQYVLNQVLSQQKMPAMPPITQEPPPPTAKSQITVLNGSGQEGAAKKLAQYLEKQGLGVAKIANAKSDDYAGISVLYADQENDKAEALVVILTSYHKQVTMKKDTTISPGTLTVIVGKLE